MRNFNISKNPRKDRRDERIILVEVRHEDFEITSMMGERFYPRCYMTGTVSDMGEMPDSGRVDVKSLANGKTYSVEVRYLKVLND